MVNREKNKKDLRERRRARVRAKIFGTAKIPRLNVFRSLRDIYVQLINDEIGKTLVAARGTEVDGKKMKKTEIAFKVGQLLAARAIKAEISQVVFDRAGYKFQGRVKAMAEGARQGGLKF